MIEMRHVEWHQPRSLDEALELRSSYGEDAVVVAGGTFVGILMNQGFLRPARLISLRGVPGLDSIREEDGVLLLGAMVTHRSVERSELVRRKWPALARTFSLVASPRVRNQATVGGVLADADYASDPPAMLAALAARVVIAGKNGEREVPVEDFILDHYTTALKEDELVMGVRVPDGVRQAVYRKFRSRSSEDRPCVSVAAARYGETTLRVVVGAVAGRPQYFPDVCALAGGEVDAGIIREIARRYAENIHPLSDARGSARYRRRVMEVEVRRALEELYGV